MIPFTISMPAKPALAPRRPGRAALLLGGALALALAGCAASVRAGRHTADAQAEQTSQPNIVFILVDDLGWRDLSLSGSEFYETPEIDRLAREGVRFDNAYAAYPRCTPSRYALMTGRNPARAQIPGGNGGEAIAPEEVTIAEALKAGGYATFFIGKWHLGKTPAAWPQSQGFDVNIGGGSAGAVHSQFYPYGAEKGRAIGPGLEQGKPGEYLADRLTDETIRLIETHRRDHPQQPFFAYLSHYAVHTPIEARADLKQHFEAKLARMGGARPDPYLARDGETKRYQDNPTYAAMIASIDLSVGRIRQTLERLGLARNTIVIFTSDHGGLSNRAAGSRREVATSNLPLRAGKGHVYEGGTRVPMIVWWPGHMQRGLRSAAFVPNTDHFPSLLQAAGLPLAPAHHLDGYSYLGLLRRSAARNEREFVWYSPRPRPQQTADTASAAIRVGQWKFVRNYDPSKPDELFDLSVDPGENRNLTVSEPQRAVSLRVRLEQWLSSIGAVGPRLGRGARRVADEADGRGEDD